MAEPSSYRTNRDLFANHYLDHLLPDSDPWTGIDESDVEDAYEEIRAIYDDQQRVSATKGGGKGRSGVIAKASHDRNRS